MSIAHFASLFILGFSSLFPLINPIGTALILSGTFSRLTPKEKSQVAYTIVSFCFLMGLSALFLGSWFLKFMGISIAATRLGGGILIARMGLTLLSAENTNQQQDAGPIDLQSQVFYPMAFPVTLGPGSIAALIALGAHAHTQSLSQTFANTGVFALSLIVVLAITYVCFMSSHFLLTRVGPTGAQVINKLMSFFLFCIGLQMIVTGILQAFPLFGEAPH